jgi:hypothetical protein
MHLVNQFQEKICENLYCYVMPTLQVSCVWLLFFVNLWFYLHEQIPTIAVVTAFAQNW